jgi:hypothetical protein
VLLSLENKMKEITETAIFFFSLVGMALFGMFMGAKIQAYEPTVADQLVCGNNPAIHVWKQNNSRLVVCEHPAGLVVREVPHEKAVF